MIHPIGKGKQMNRDCGKDFIITIFISQKQPRKSPSPIANTRDLRNEKAEGELARTVKDPVLVLAFLFSLMKSFGHVLCKLTKP